jgi:predicted TIM-barrel enzyme
LEGTGLGYQRELDMLCAARKLDLLTIGYAFNETDTEVLMAKADPDIYIFHAGITRGGTTGYAGGSSLEEMARRSQHHFEIARKFRPDVILLAHGAALVNPEDAEYLYRATDCHGIQLGSSIERLAIEEPLKKRAALFKATAFRPKPVA